MQKRYIYYIFFIGFLLKGILGYAQEPLSLYYIENIPQSHLLNPAMTPRCNGYIAIPGGVFNGNMQFDISPRVFLQNSDEGVVSLLNAPFDYKKFNRRVGKGMSLRSSTNISLFGLGFRGKRGYYTFSISEKLKMNAALPTDLFNIFDKGFPDGASFDFSKFGMNFQLYQEFAFGYTRDFSDRLKIGAKLKVLQGFYSMKTNVKTFDLNTGKEQWDFIFVGDVYSSAPVEIMLNENGGIDSIAPSQEFEDQETVEMLTGKLTDFSNMGLGLDIGMTYEFNNRISFSASLIDFGVIRWTKDMNSVHFDGEYSFKGLDIKGEELDSIGPAVEALMDTVLGMEAQFGHDKYSTGLGTTLYLGGEFNVNHYLSLGVLSRTIFDKKYLHQTFGFSANINPWRVLAFNLNYNVSFTGEQYAGLGFSYKLGPLQNYIIIDNIPLSYQPYVIDGKKSFPVPTDLRQLNIMVGFNIVFGARGFRDHPKVGAYSEF